MSGSAAMAALAEVWPEDGIAVVETPSSTVALRNRLRLSRPGSYYFSASGGLGFGIAASVGVQLAQPERPVVCVLGEGSAQYGITALWTAAAYRVPVTFLVLRNEEYMILKWFAEFEQANGAARAWTSRASTSPPSRRPTGSPRSRWATREELDGGAARGDRRAGGPAPGAGAGGHGNVARLRVALLEADASAHRAGGGAPAPDRAPDWVADGTPEPLRGELRAALGAEQVATRALDLVALRLRREPLPRDPQGGRDPARRRRRRGAARARAPHGTPLVFRAGGTSLSGQSQTDGILVDVRRHLQRVRVEEDGALVRAQPGAVLGHVNRRLARHGAAPRPRPGEHRHRVRGRRRRQQLGRHALRRRTPTPTGRCAR